MLTVAKYYAASLFLIAIYYIAAITAPNGADTFRAALPISDFGMLDYNALRPLLYAWTMLGGVGALLGLAGRMMFPIVVPVIMKKHDRTLGSVSVRTPTFGQSPFRVLRPGEQSIECWTQGLSPVGQAVFNLRRHLVMDDAAHDAITFHLPKLLDQHLLRDAWDGSLQVGETQELAAEKMKQDHELPSTFQHLEGLLHAVRR